MDRRRRWNAKADLLVELLEDMAGCGTPGGWVHAGLPICQEARNVRNRRQAVSKCEFKREEAIKVDRGRQNNGKEEKGRRCGCMCVRSKGAVMGTRPDGREEELTFARNASLVWRAW